MPYRKQEEGAVNLFKNGQLEKNLKKLEAVETSGMTALQLEEHEAGVLAIRKLLAKEKAFYEKVASGSCPHVPVRSVVSREGVSGSSIRQLFS